MLAMAESSLDSSIKNQALKETFESMRSSIVIDSEELARKSSDNERTLVQELEECKRKLAQAILSPEVYLTLIEQ
jgi:anti-anti-sigma regulatory factor